MEYSYRARLRDVTDMRVTIEHSANPNFTADVQLGDGPDLAEMRSFDVSSCRLLLYFFFLRAISHSCTILHSLQEQHCKRGR